MGVYNRGRPRKIQYEEVSDIPHKAGEYRIRDKETKAPLYIGETNDLRRRASEHQKTGKFGPGTTLEYMVANSSTSEERRKHEQQSIKKHSPSLNRSRGGEGRPAKNDVPMNADIVKPTEELQLTKQRLQWLVIIGYILLFIVAVLVFLFSIGTVFPGLPFIGSVANILTVGYAHLWLPTCAVLFLIALALCLANRKKVSHWVAFVLSAVSLAATVVFLCGNASVLKQYGVKPNVFLAKEDVSGVQVETYPYTQSEYGTVYLNAYYTEDVKADKPIMVYIHGGGWIQGSRNEHSYYSSVFAKHGYAVFSVDYDLSTPERHLAETTETQIAEAFAWVKNHAADFGADITQLYVTGGSAGGNLALELSYKINAGVYQTAADGTELPTVKAVSVTFPVASVETFYHNDDLVLGGMAYNMAACYTGCSPDENPALFDSLAPANAITASAPATNILVGEADSLVPPEATYELDTVMETAGIVHQTVIVPFANHIFDMVDGNMMNCAYLDLSLRWFDQH